MSDVEPETDLVVVGSGVGGLTAAVTAAIERDLAVTVLEKGSVLGGSSGLSGGQLWVPANHHMLQEGIDDDVDSGVDYMTALAGELYADPEAARRYVEHAHEAVRYLEDEAGVTFQVAHGLPDYHTEYPGALEEGRYLEPAPFDRDGIPEWADLPDSPHLPGGVTFDELLSWGGAFSAGDWDWDLIRNRREEGIVTMGTALIGSLLHAGAERDLTVHAEAPVTGLVVEDGTVRGVAVDDGASVVRASHGVVLNTGAYDWNPSFIEDFEGTPSEHMVSAAVPTATGDGLRMAANQGAKLGVYPPIGGAKGFFVEVPDREFLDAPLYRYCYNVGLPHALAVNSDGERFCDESFYPKQADKLYDPTGEYEWFPPYMVFDDQYRERYPLGNYKPGEEYPEEFLAAKAESIPELARSLGVDEATLTATVERFNDHARDGEDPDFGRGENEWANVWCGDPGHDPNPNLGPVTEPPFYAVRLYVGLSSMGNVGLLTDGWGRVTDWNEQPIDGLYAVGSVCAPVEWGVGYQSGLQNGRSLTHGYLVGKHVADST